MLRFLKAQVAVYAYGRLGYRHHPHGAAQTTQSQFKCMEQSAHYRPYVNNLSKLISLNDHRDEIVRWLSVNEQVQISISKIERYIK